MDFLLSAETCFLFYFIFSPSLVCPFCHRLSVSSKEWLEKKYKKNVSLDGGISVNQLLWSRTYNWASLFLDSFTFLAQYLPSLRFLPHLTTTFAIDCISPTLYEIVLYNKPPISLVINITFSCLKIRPVSSSLLKFCSFIADEATLESWLNRNLLEMDHFLSLFGPINGSNFDFVPYFLYDTRMCSYTRSYCCLHILRIAVAHDNWMLCAVIVSWHFSPNSWGALIEFSYSGSDGGITSPFIYDYFYFFHVDNNNKLSSLFLSDGWSDYSFFIDCPIHLLIPFFKTHWCVFRRKMQEISFFYAGREGEWNECEWTKAAITLYSLKLRIVSGVMDFSAQVKYLFPFFLIFKRVLLPSKTAVIAAIYGHPFL